VYYIKKDEQYLSELTLKGGICPVCQSSAEPSFKLAKKREDAYGFCTKREAMKASYWVPYPFKIVRVG